MKVVEGWHVVQDVKQDLVGREGSTEPLECTIFSHVSNPPPELLGQQWLVHSDHSVSAADDHRQIAS